ncbi:type II toxin-antitoxin system PemK/MazF family toxin [Nocardioides seonyuensis]|uniref:mRNA interferase n=1 Tax=Nocardioides seonyuensis TaxID=2518371 RepID=A0A4P7IF48_9ACTN|nr:type II toxin-antitoxin system PemK/MazF family toxin [Nocardioides seonyuensis]QBX55884.1 type II toxin-antitoxin system PemK/MazF family toxin [Nocardioides seonyuensis]
MREVRRGDVVWADFDPTRGRERAGERPAVVVASDGYLDAVPDLVIVLPVTTVDRDWPHHVQLRGSRLDLRKPSWALTEQPRTISRSRLSRASGRVDVDCLAEIDQWLRDFLDLP